MRGYLQLLERLSPEQSLAPHAPKQAILLSGQSDFLHSELTREQRALLQVAEEFGYATVPVGFPFNQAHRGDGSESPTGIWQASLRNIVQFNVAMWSPRYRAAIARHLQPFFDRARELLVLSQSQGLHMLEKATPLLEIHPETRITVVAFGPVASRRFSDPRFALQVVKGRRDWYARLLDRHRADALVDSNHFDYFQHPEIREWLRETLTHED